MYQMGKRQEKKRNNKLFWWIFAFVFVGVVVFTVFIILDMLKPKTTIRQGQVTTRKIDYSEDSKTKMHNEANFNITLPIAWKKQPSPAGTYTTYNWKNINKTQNNESITIYEDTIPLKFAVNRVVIVEPETDHVTIKGDVSDNCSAYTKNISQVQNQSATPAKWQGVDFLCEQGSTTRDVVGTSSVDGINIVNLVSPSVGKSHKYFFTYTNNSINGDYVVFTNALSSFRMQ